MYACYDEVPAGIADESLQLARFAPLVKRVARQLSSQASSVLEREDMEQIGLLALLESLRRYGVPDEGFAGFAMLRIRGAILDELRRLDWRPRTVRQDAHRVRDALRALTRQLGREPSQQEACSHLGLDAASYQAALMAENAEQMASFDELLAAGFEPAAAAGPEQAAELRSSLQHALLALEPREQQVIQLYYEYELSLKEIALVLDLTEARVCQINKAALRRMRSQLAA